ncbi:MAG: DUF4405 domain-containing protein [Desulfocapsaceae bacterium]|nr:DUF4405 domain-containing protein [Desulfocapsaceae bacterium]
MNLRKVISLTMLLSFALCILTSIVLYVVPEGRISYWAEWRLWGLSKSEWGNLHINLGFLFLFAGLLHLCYNWSVVAAYMKNRAREMKIFTASFNVALILTLVVGLGTYWQIPPLSTILNLGHSFKDAAAIKYGEPPYGHAELSPLRSFFKKAEIDPVKAMELFAKAGITMENDQETVAAIAARNHLTPKALYEIIKPASTAIETTLAIFPDEPVPGFGHKTLAEICTEYNLQPAMILQGLARENVTALPEQTIREIAGSVNMDPHAFFTILHRVATQQNK